MDLAELMALVVVQWPFDDDHYADWDTMRTSEQRIFALRHVLLHEQKSLGGIAALLEPLDHSGATFFDEVALKALATKMIVNAVRMAAVAGLTPEELSDALQCPAP